MPRRAGKRRDVTRAASFRFRGRQPVLTHLPRGCSLGEIRYSMRQQPREAGRSEEIMGAFRFLTALYIIVFVLMVLIAIGSFFGVFTNPLIDPGM